MNNSTRVIWISVMMTSWNGNIFRVSGPLWGESTGHRWIPLPKTGLDAFFGLRLNKRLRKQAICWWFEIHCTHHDVTVMAIHASCFFSHMTYQQQVYHTGELLTLLYDTFAILSRMNQSPMWGNMWLKKVVVLFNYRSYVYGYDACILHTGDSDDVGCSRRHQS